MATYTLISSVTVGSGGATSIDFTSIPATYTDLVVLTSLRSTGTNGTCVVYFNNDTTNANYSVIRIFGSGSSVGNNSYTAPYFMYSNLSNTTASTFSSSYLYIPNYRSSNYKSISADDVTENNAADASQFLSAGLWNNSAAITSIKIQQAVDTGFVQYSTAYLYGISNA